MSIIFWGQDVTPGPRDCFPGMLQMVRTLAQFSIALDEMQENGESVRDDGGGGGATGEESDSNNRVAVTPQNNTEVPRSSAGDSFTWIHHLLMVLRSCCCFSVLRRGTGKVVGLENRAGNNKNNEGGL